MLLFVTAFEPFGGAGENASQKVLELLPEAVGEVFLKKALLPTAFGESWEVLKGAIAGARPDALLCLGEAGGRRALTVERVAVNLMDARIPDNAGAQPRDVPIDPEGPAAYFSTLPTREMADAAGGELSYTAGTFVCNYIFYMARRHFPGPAGFLHVPTIGTMDAPTAAAGVTAAIGALGKSAPAEGYATFTL